MNQHERTIAILLVLTLLILCITGCSVIQRSHFWQPETANTEIIVTSSYHLIFHHRNVDLDVHQLGGWNATYFFGPPFIPILPSFLFPPYRKKALYVMPLIEIRSPDDTTIIDFAKAQLRYSEGGILQLRMVREWREGSKEFAKAKMPMGRTTIANKKGSYLINFDNVPYRAEEIELDFGNLEINGNEVKVPVFKWRMVRKYLYEPLYNP